MNNKGNISFARRQALIDISKWILSDCGHNDTWLIGQDYITSTTLVRLSKEITIQNKELDI
tara:strand:- start:810 stop:992 length:183 start_codon:yes stop_codon:yes gene_type:complete